jgi:hypothetical protein
MPAMQPGDHETLEANWRQNEAELNRQHSMTLLGRESYAGRIEYELGAPDAQPRSRR